MFRNSIKKNHIDTYQDLWAGQKKNVRKLIREGEASFPRLVSSITKDFHDNRIEGQEYDFPIYSFGKPFTKTPTPFEFKVLKHAAITSLLLDYVKRFKNIDWIMELGSGLSNNLFQLWMDGGPKNAQYIGYEITRSGRETAKLLSSFEKGINFQAKKFDYYKINLKDHTFKGNGIIFSSYSIEQITNLPEDTLEILSKIPGLKGAIHFEPISWQLSWLKNNKGDYALKDKEIKKYLNLCEKDARKRNYNLNFGDLLNKAHKEKIIQVDLDFSKRIYMSHRFDLPAALIYWEPIKEKIY